MIRNLFFSLILIYLGFACSRSTTNYKATIPSPNAKVHIYFELNNGEPYYMMYFKNEVMIDWSPLGLITEHDSLINEFYLVEAKSKLTDVPEISDMNQYFNQSDQFNEMLFLLERNTLESGKIGILLRAYDDGISYRYLLFSEDEKNEIRILSEESAFGFTLSEGLLRDTLLNPTLISMGHGIDINITGLVSEDYPDFVLVKDQKDQLQYNIYLNNNSEEFYYLRKPYYSPWRILQFTMYEE